MTDLRRDRYANSAAIVVAVLMIAVHIAAKANRDAIFLSTFTITDLPRMMIAAAVVSILMVLVASKAMVRWGPQRLIPMAFGCSSVLYAGVWGLMQVAPMAAAVMLYLHVTAIGVILISGFWSLLNERFDPHSAKRTIGRVVAASTLGGLLGGIGAERFAAWLDVDKILLVLCVLHATCGLLLRGMAGSASASTRTSGEMDDGAEKSNGSAFGVLKRASYLRNLGLLVILGTVAAAILDFVYKSHATQRFTSTESLVRFFAVYYVVVALVTFGVQSLVSRRALEKLGLGKTSGVLPLTTALGGIAVILVPRLATAVVARFSEAVLRSSLFRSAYELFFIPIPAADKRATKTIIDVGFDRLGDVIGGGLIALALVAIPVLANSVLLGVAVAMSITALLIITRLQQGYVKALEQSLANQSLLPDSPELDDPVTRSIMMKTVTEMDLRHRSKLVESALLSRSKVLLSDLAGTAASPKSSPSAARSVLGRPGDDPLLADIAALRSGSVEIIRPLLTRTQPLDPALTPHLLPLIARPELEHDTVKMLRKLAPQVTGQLLDALLDSKEEFIIRRRIPKALADCATQRAADGLVLALVDRRFEVRYKVGLALASIHQANPELTIDRSQVFSSVLSELNVDRRVWQDRRLLDGVDDSFQSIFVDDLLRSRAKRSLEHVFTLLSLAMNSESLKIAFRGLHTDDKMLRGTAIEYLDVVLPTEILEKIRPLISEGTKLAPTAAKPADEVEAELARSSHSITMNLEAIREVMDKHSDDDK